MMSGYDFDPYVHSIARRQPRRLPACLAMFVAGAFEFVRQRPCIIVDATWAI